MNDPYRYFRIEGRELADELSAGLSTLARGTTSPELVGALLRHTHTLKGAARVVAQPHIADLAHALEELLEPYRDSGEVVPEERVADLQALCDEISDRVDGLGGGDGVDGTEGARPDDGLAEALAEALTQPPTQPHAGCHAEPLTSVPTPRAGDRPPPGPGRSERPDPAATPTAVPTPAATPTAAPTAAPAAPAAPVGTARVSLAEIEAVIRGVGEARTQLVVLRQNGGRLGQLRSGLFAAPGPDPAARLREIAALEHQVEQVQRALSGCVDRLERELSQVHDIAERLRLVPVASIVPDLERAARDVAATQGKRVLVDVVGAELRLDAPVLATAQDALRQIVRNAVAHGIEPPPERVAAGKPPGGRVRLLVTQRAGQVVFSCSDDGRGVDLPAVRRELARATRAGGEAVDVDGLDDSEVLDRLLQGGLSTAVTVSEVSGRGIGMDVARAAVQRLGGQLSIRSTLGAGTTVDLASPLSLTFQDLVLVDAGQLVALPLAAVAEVVRVPARAITSRPQGETLVHRGQLVPFLPLAAVLGVAGATSRSQHAWSVLMVRGVGLGVRRVVGTSGAAIRALPRLAPIPDVVAGVWMDVGGRPRLVLDPIAVAARAPTQHGAVRAAPVVTPPILVVDDSLTTRMLEVSILESAGYDVELASSGEEGLAMVAAKAYSLVLVDVEMPGLDGFAFVERARARPELRHLPCILVTSRASEEDRARGLAAGAFGHIDKARFAQGALLSLIADALAG